MSLLSYTKGADGNPEISSLEEKLAGQLTQKGKNPDDLKADKSEYNPTPEEKEARMMVIRHFTLGYQTMYYPRVEFNDLPVIDRDVVDKMLFNTYQENNGDPYAEDEINAWRSRAIRPVVRNKAISIAAHATARLIFPKITAVDNDSDEQRDAAQVMEDLVEWSADQSNYSHFSLRRTIEALCSPASIGYTEYAEVYRTVKTEKGEDGKWKTEEICDETLSGFQDYVVPVDELFIENFYEPDIQKQAWLIWRKVLSYDLAQAKYGKNENFKKYVKPGMQVLYNDPNQTFYQVYDPTMRPYDVEEVIYWNKNLDLKLILVNGVLITPYDNPNPRIDKLYPFDKFGYELINNRCFYYKSLAFKLQHDADIVNTLYPMIIDGTYLNIMPPMINVGGEMIGSDVVVPGVVTTLQSENADLRPVNTSNNLRAGMDTLFKVEESVSESSQEPLQQGQSPKGGSTAYEISRLEQNAATVLGLFIKMISDHVRSFGKLRIGDILQYLTIADVSKIANDEHDVELIYKTFMLQNKQTNGKSRTRKIKFDIEMSSDPQTPEEQLEGSYDVLALQGGPDSDTELYKVNPELFRDYKYSIMVTPDVLNPKSDELERAFDLELYDRLIANPRADQDQALKLLLATNPKTKKDPDRYVAKAGPMMPLGMGAPTGLSTESTGNPLEAAGMPSVPKTPVV